MLDAVIFDMDGVIVDSEPVYLKAVNRVLEPLGKSITKEYSEQFFGGSPDAMWTATLSYLKLDDKLMVDDCVQAMLEIREQIIAKEGYLPIHGTIPLIKDLHAKNIPLAVASSATTEDIVTVTEAMGIRKYFQHLISGQDECRHVKPAPDVFIKAGEKLGVRPERCIIIEDAYNGIIAGKKAGMHVIGFQNPEYGSLKLKGADHIVTDIQDITLELCKEIIGAVKKLP